MRWEHYEAPEAAARPGAGGGARGRPNWARYRQNGPAGPAARSRPGPAPALTRLRPPAPSRGPASCRPLPSPRPPPLPLPQTGGPSAPRRPPARGPSTHNSFLPPFSQFFIHSAGSTIAIFPVWRREARMRERRAQVRGDAAAREARRDGRAVPKETARAGPRRRVLRNAPRSDVTEPGNSAAAYGRSVRRPFVPRRALQMRCRSCAFRNCQFFYVCVRTRRQNVVLSNTGLHNLSVVLKHAAYSAVEERSAPCYMLSVHIAVAGINGRADS